MLETTCFGICCTCALDVIFQTNVGITQYWLAFDVNEIMFLCALFIGIYFINV